VLMQRYRRQLAPLKDAMPTPGTGPGQRTADIVLGQEDTPGTSSQARPPDPAKW